MATLHQFTADDVDVLARTIYAESRGESIEGQIAVGNVIVNRYLKAQERAGLKGQFGEDIQDTMQLSRLNDNGVRVWQFSCWNPADHTYTAMMNATNNEPAFVQARAIAYGLLTGQINDNTKNADHYYNPKVATPKWAEDGVQTGTVGNHRFSRFHSVQPERNFSSHIEMGSDPIRPIDINVNFGPSSDFAANRTAPEMIPDELKAQKLVNEDFASVEAGIETLELGSFASRTGINPVTGGVVPEDAIKTIDNTFTDAAIENVLYERSQPVDTINRLAEDMLSAEQDMRDFIGTDFASVEAGIDALELGSFASRTGINAVSGGVIEADPELSVQNGVTDAGLKQTLADMSRVYVDDVPLPRSRPSERVETEAPVVDDKTIPLTQGVTISYAAQDAAPPATRAQEFAQNLVELTHDRLAEQANNDLQSALNEYIHGAPETDVAEIEPEQAAEEIEAAQSPIAFPESMPDSIRALREPKVDAPVPATMSEDVRIARGGATAPIPQTASMELQAMRQGQLANVFNPTGGAEPILVASKIEVDNAPQEYKVQSGDSLSSISRKVFGLTDEQDIAAKNKELAELNNLRNANMIKVGQDLIISKPAEAAPGGMA